MKIVNSKPVKEFKGKVGIHTAVNNEAGCIAIKKANGELISISINKHQAAQVAKFFNIELIEKKAEAKKV